MTRLAIPLIIASTQLLADDNCPTRCGCPPEPVCDEHLFVERCQTFVSGEFLYWAAEEPCADYAIKMDCGTESSNSFAIGDYKVSDFEYCPGGRVTLGWYNYPKYWEVNAQYTWLRTHGSDSVLTPGDGVRFLNPTWGVTGTLPICRATSDIELEYQLGDLYVARVFDPNPHLRMRFLGGVTIAYILQDWDITYTDSLARVEKLDNDWRYFAGGLRLGTTVDWFWGNEFYFTGRTTFAALLGSYKNTARQTTWQDIVVRNSKYNDPRFAFHMQFLLGPSWQRPCECWSIELFAGYEFNLWFNLHETFRSSFSDLNAAKITNNGNGLMGLHGLTVRLTFGF